MFDPVETREQFLAEVQAMPDFLGKVSTVQNAKWLTSRICPPLLAERNQFHVAQSVPTDEQALQKCRIAR
jgi:hypothetical protein